MKEAYVKRKANIYHFEKWVSLTKPKVLKNTLEQLILKSGFSIVNFMEHHFPVEGYTCVWLLAESHLAIHTFPNQQQSYIQLSSCNEEKRKMLSTLIENSLC